MTLKETRSEILSKLKKETFDFTVIGGGIHGATFAHLAALNGFKVALIEKNDYAWATSSRSSKMAHGGLRYLELGDISQVLEGVKAREDLFTTARHLVHPQKFLYPLKTNQKFFKLKLKTGLTIYDWFVKKQTRKHSWIQSCHLYTE